MARNKQLESSKLHPAPYQGSNNGKKTLGRLKNIKMVQSVPVWETSDEPTVSNPHGFPVKSSFLGYKYIQHGVFM